MSDAILATDASWLKRRVQELQNQVNDERIRHMYTRAWLWVLTAVVAADLIWRGFAP